MTVASRILIHTRNADARILLPLSCPKPSRSKRRNHPYEFFHGFPVISMTVASRLLIHTRNADARILPLSCPKPSRSKRSLKMPRERSLRRLTTMRPPRSSHHQGICGPVTVRSWRKQKFRPDSRPAPPVPSGTSRVRSTLPFGNESTVSPGTDGRCFTDLRAPTSVRRPATRFLSRHRLR
jgi:hypothetical protein